MTPRRGLDPNAPLRALFVERSGNKKLGPIPLSIVSASTCPPSCSFYGNGCYAEFHLLKQHWAQAPTRGLRWQAFCDRIARLPAGQLWRYAEAGDLPGRGERIDVGRFRRLIGANAAAGGLGSGGARGFTFTHKPLDGVGEREVVRLANEHGFTVNLSAEGLDDADRKAELGVAPVAAVVPASTPRGARTPAGRHVVLCPAETHGMTCSECQLCACATRKSIVGFRAHGQMQRHVSGLVELRRKSTVSVAAASTRTTALASHHA